MKKMGKNSVAEASRVYRSAIPGAKMEIPVKIARFTEEFAMSLYLKQSALAAFAIAVLAASVLAQAGGGGLSAESKQRLQALKQSVAANQQKLKQYQWTEVQQLTLKGETKPQQQFMCQYGPDGKVQKFPMGEQQQPSGGRLKQRMIAKKKAEMQDYLGEVKSLLSEYLPPNPQKMQQAVGTHNLSLSQDAAAGIVNMTFTNYAQQGDQMVITFAPKAKRISNINVNTYMGEAKDKVTLMITYSTLPDGTNFPEKTVLDLPAKQMHITTLNTNYHKFGQPGM